MSLRQEGTARARLLRPAFDMERGVPPIDWSQVWNLTVSPWELIVRGSVMYWFIFIAFRTFMRRDIGSIAVSDVLFLMLVADAAQNAMAGEYRSITDGIVLVGTLLLWNIAVDWAAYASPALRRVLAPRSILLVRNGALIRPNLRKQFITEDELCAKLREHGVEDLSTVKEAHLEADGDVSVLTRRTPAGMAPAPACRV
jgi:uncharacterized membrane protein YcaP (DUF421 family)